MNSFPIKDIRAEFPAISVVNGAPAPVFLDNPAGTQLPRRVIDAVSAAMINSSSNLGGYFASSRNADGIWERAHQAVADMLGATSMREIIIGPNMTTLTLHLSRSIARTLSPGDEIIVTRMDHEGDVAPWLLMAEDNGLVVKWLPFNEETWRIEPEDLASLLTDRTRLLALNYASNLTGSINDVPALTAMAKAASAMVFVDAVQFAPHGLIDVQALGCDFLACSAYKFFGPHMGVIWGREDLLRALPAYKCRCADDALPGRFETGTPQTELLAGLEAAVGYLAWIGEITGHSGDRRALLTGAFESFADYERRLTTKLIDGISGLGGTTVHGITNSNRIADRVPTVSFTHHDSSPQKIAKLLADQGICVWSGHNYAYEVVRQLGLDEVQGVVRIGLAHYNTEAEIDGTLAALARVLQ
ncbi:MAG TPA: cysteine desulfurase-like protein [Thermohalobaculum sp.]|nr:cysteine desulfurase-like protein [Thermohalobaculum sp.]